MKSNIMWKAGSWMIVAALAGAPVYADEAAAAEATAQAAASTVEAAEESVDEAVDAVKEIGQELGITEEAAATQADAATQPAEAQVEADAGQMDAETQAAMAEWMAHANPSDHHAKLDAFVGEWNITNHYWMVPDAPAQVSDGTSKIKWVLGGRFLTEKYHSRFAMPGMPEQAFKGIGMTGYDNAKGQYVSTWQDTMNTAITSSTGQFDDSTQTLTLSNDFDCPMDGPCDMRMTMTVVGPDELNMKAYKTPEGGEESKVMEIIYKRKTDG